MRTQTFASLFTIATVALGGAACGSGGDEVAVAEAAPASVAAVDSAASPPETGSAGGGLTVASSGAGERTLAATDAYWVQASDAYYDIYFTDQPMTSSSLAYGPSVPDGKVLVVAPVENRDGTAIAAGQTFTFDASSNSRMTAMIRTGSARETFTVVDDVSLGSITIDEISGDTIRGSVDVVKDDKVLRGPFTAKRLPG